MPTKVLVTGADGFIGSHLTEALVRAGYPVKAFVLYNSFNAWGWLDHCADEVRGQFEVFAGDIRDPHGVRTAMTGCEAVLHLAALIAIPYSYHSPDTYVDTNIKGTLNVVQAARELGIIKVVHTSTSEVYGTARFVPITEDHPLQGQSPYSASKIDAVEIIRRIAITYDEAQQKGLESNVTDNLESSVLEHLRAIRSEQDKHSERFRHLEARTGNLETTVAGLRRDLAHMYGEIVEQHTHTDQLVARIERIERRLELQDG
jgi:dTDP-4-dehydrorhamnose reductase